MMGFVDAGLLTGPGKVKAVLENAGRDHRPADVEGPFLIGLDLLEQ